MSAPTLSLARYAVTGGRARDIVGTLDFLVEQTAQARGWRIARVRSAAPIDEAQRTELTDSLGSLAGAPVELQVEVDESLLSGALDPHRRPAGGRHGAGPHRRPARALRPGRLGAGGVRTTGPEFDGRDRGSTVMAELTIDASEITKALERHVEDYTPAVGTEQIGRIVEVGDGIARVSGLPGAAVNELLEFEDGTLGLALNLDEDTIGAVVLGEVDSLEEEQTVKATGRIQTGAGRRRPARPGGQRPGRAARRQGPDQHHRDPPHGGAGPRHRRPPAGERAAADRDQGHRRHDADRPGPARADHRRPQDGQDDGGHRHHHQPGRPGREVHLRRHRPEELVGGPDGGHPRGPRRARVHRRGGRLGRGPGPVQVPGALRRLRHGPALDGERRARADHLRRPVQAGRGLPRRLAPAAAATGPRGLPGRRLLPALAGCSSGRPSCPTRWAGGR